MCGLWALHPEIVADPDTQSVGRPTSDQSFMTNTTGKNGVWADCAWLLGSVLLLAVLLPIELGAVSPQNRTQSLVLIGPEDGKCLAADGGPAVSLHAWSNTAGEEQLSIKASVGRVSQIKKLGSGLFRLWYQAPRQSDNVTVVFQSPLLAEPVSMPLCPFPAGRLRVTPQPEKLLAGGGLRATLSIRATDENNRPVSGLDLSASTNVGSLGPITDLGHGNYRLLFVPPDDPYPQVAVIMIANPDLARLNRIGVARAVIPITAQLNLPGKTAPGTKIEMRVAKRRFGPVTADRTGRFSLPVLVPPGYGTARAKSIDRAGNQKMRSISLYLPETNRLALWAHPKKLRIADNPTSRLLITTVDRYGQPMDVSPKTIQINTDCGSLSKIRPVALGLYESYYTACEKVSTGLAEIKVKLRQAQKSAASLSMQLLPGDVEHIRLDLPKLHVADGKSRGLIKIRLSDRYNNPIRGARLSVLANPGRIETLEETESGVYLAKLVVQSNPLRWLSEVEVTVDLHFGSQPARLVIAKDSLQALPQGFRIQTAVLDRLSLPVVGTPVQFVDQQHKTDQVGRVVFRLPDLGPGLHQRMMEINAPNQPKRQISWWVEKHTCQLLDIDLDSRLPRNQPLVRKGSIRLLPETNANVIINARRVNKLRHQVNVTVRDSAGKGLSSRDIQLSTSHGRVSPIREVGQGQYQADWNLPTGFQKALVSAVDAQSQVGAVLTLVEENH